MLESVVQILEFEILQNHTLVECQVIVVLRGIKTPEQSAAGFSARSTQYDFAVKRGKCAAPET